MSRPVNQNRIWELDALRGLMLLFVAFSHFCIYFNMMVVPFKLPSWLQFVFDNGGMLFILLSGLCATLGRRSFRRGVLVFACGMVLQLGSALMARLGYLDDSMVIRFGILHLLGACMMLYPLLKRLPDAVLLAAGILIVAGGYLLELREVTVRVPFLYPFGLVRIGFTSGDYFPLLPHLGWFCVGAFFGRRLYAEHTTRLPHVNADFFLLRFFRFCGRHSLILYLTHIPVLAAGCYLLGRLLAKS